VPVLWISRSASVDFPWSICATIEKLRMFLSSVMGEGMIEVLGRVKGGWGLAV